MREFGQFQKSFLLNDFVLKIIGTTIQISKKKIEMKMPSTLPKKFWKTAPV